MITTETKKPSLLSNLTVQILIAMIIGALLGIYIQKKLPKSLVAISKC